MVILFFILSSTLASRVSSIVRVTLSRVISEKLEPLFVLRVVDVYLNPSAYQVDFFAAQNSGESEERHKYSVGEKGLQQVNVQREVSDAVASLKIYSHFFKVCNKQLTNFFDGAGCRDVA